MIQELLGGAGLVGGERKISISRVLENSTSPNSLSSSPTLSPSPSPSPSSSTTSTPAGTSSENPNLRCPRCDSSNTKFCYYNNYNLTQPRHFCKTCRRYWTKGGALRNVPIGGGCRKNKNAATIASSIGKSSSSSGKFKSPEFGKSGLVSGLDHQQFPSNPNILWASQQNSHLLAFLRATQNPNPNPNPMSNSFGLKEEHGVLSGTHLASDFNGRALGLDHLGQASSIGLCGSFWRNNQEQAQQNHHTQHQNGFNIVSEVQNSGVQDLYQRLRSSSANYYPDHLPVVMGNVVISSASNTTSSSTILDSAPVGGSEMGYWNPIPSWSDLPTTNGTAYP